MKVVTTVLVLFSVIGHAVSAIQAVRNETKTSKHGKRCDSRFDILLDRLSAQSWTDDETPCLVQLLDTIQNAKNATLWATWVWDSMQLPVGQLFGSKYHLGNYDQCLREKIGASAPPYPTQYCLADILMQPNKENRPPTENVDPYGPADAYIGSQTRLVQHFNEISWGVCVPRVCTQKAVEKFVRVLWDESHLGTLRPPTNISIGCELPWKPEENIDGRNILLVFVLITSFIVVSCTVYLSKKSSANPVSLVESIIRCFCLKRNTKEFMQGPKNDVKVLNGLRFMSSATIVLVHVIFVSLAVSTGNGLDFEELLHSYGLIILNLVVVVDTFFFMSGLLFMRNIKNSSTTWDLIEALIKRYFRLLWWYLADVLSVIFVLPDSGCGPVCSKFVGPEQEGCLQTWWSGILMLGNYIDIHRMCAPIAWYIFCDFQLSVVACLLFWVYQRNRRVGFACFGILTFLSVLVPGLVAYSMPEIAIIPFEFDLYQKMRDSTLNPMMMALYAQTHYRASPYLLGMVIGYIMANYSAQEIRSFFTKKLLINIIVIIIPLSVTLVMLFVNGSDSLKASLLLALHRPIWVLILCVVIGLCEYGSFPIVNDFLSWSVFVPISKLTYGIYMIHCTIIILNLACTRSPLYFSTGIMMEKFFGNLALAAIISLYFMLFVESPLNNLVKMALAHFGKAKTRTIEMLQNGLNKMEVNGNITDTALLNLKEKLS